MAFAGPAAKKQLTAKQRGKQQAEPQEEANDDATQAAVQELQWRAGVNRQAQPAAHEHLVDDRVERGGRARRNVDVAWCNRVRYR